MPRMQLTDDIEGLSAVQRDQRDPKARLQELRIPFFCLDPRMVRNDSTSDFRLLLKIYKEMGFTGIGEYVPNIPIDDPLNMNLFRQVGEFGFPLIFHMAPAIGGYYGVYDDVGLPGLERVLKECPDLILLGHSPPFWAEISADVSIENRNVYNEGEVKPGRVVELMRKYPSLHGDLSAASGLTAISRDIEFGCRFIEEFQDRLYFGTDLCVDVQGLDEKPLFQVLKEKIVPYYHKLRNEKLISAEAFEKITWKNANRLLGLGLE